MSGTEQGGEEKTCKQITLSIRGKKKKCHVDSKKELLLLKLKRPEGSRITI